MKALTFDDVALVPYYNNVDSRVDGNAPSLYTYISEDVAISIPILASNMESVIGEELADVLYKYGSVPIHHRYSEEQFKVREDKRFFVSWGCNNIENLIGKLKDRDDILGVCFDVAHGHSEKMKRAICKVRDAYPTLSIIAGAVCTERAISDYAQWGADAARVGVGPGAACTTRKVTGFGVPQFSALLDCSAEAKRHKLKIICDGGIRGSDDILKALAAGADAVMIGKLFAATDESAAEKRRVEQRYRLNPQHELTGIRHIIEAKYRGQASESFQEDCLGGLKEGTVPEGESAWIPVTGSASQLLDKLIGGIRSGLTYGGARSIKEFQEHVKYVEVTPFYSSESNTRLRS